MDCFGVMPFRCSSSLSSRLSRESAENVTQRLRQQQHCHGNNSDMLTYAALRTRARTPHPTASQLSSPASATAVALTAAQHEREALAFTTHYVLSELNKPAIPNYRIIIGK
ncbi:unnamed protein product [Cercopithifilaria johnstoni]|uniref:Uncharacterized protein n=1 Tax=Cercopithifilaria johnstoni TaxID=2874296 RepID=A0A8J2MK48_9BILA|nr:unnamed protein product [Cercopithifilaria johnstoni]